jgi:hypothetical protein
MREGDVELFRGGSAPGPADMENAKQRITRYNQKDGPRIGDIVILPDGRKARLGIAWYDITREDIIQPTDPEWAASIYLADDGTADTSAAFEHGYPRDMYEDTGEKQPATFWIEHGSLIGGTSILSKGCSVHVRFPVRVYRIRAENETNEPRMEEPR